MAIIGTGGVVGIGLAVQIVLSLFNMYGPKGKAVVAVLLLLGGGRGWARCTPRRSPRLQAEKDTLATKPEPAAEPKAEAAKPANGNGAKVLEVAPVPRPAGVGGRGGGVAAGAGDRDAVTRGRSGTAGRRAACRRRSSTRTGPGTPRS